MSKHFEELEKYIKEGRQQDKAMKNEIKSLFENGIVDILFDADKEVFHFR